MTLQAWGIEKKQHEHTSGGEASAAPTVEFAEEAQNGDEAQAFWFRMHSSAAAIAELKKGLTRAGASGRDGGGVRVAVRIGTHHPPAAPAAAAGRGSGGGDNAAGAKAGAVQPVGADGEVPFRVSLSRPGTPRGAAGALLTNGLSMDTPVHVQLEVLQLEVLPTVEQREANHAVQGAAESMAGGGRAGGGANGGAALGSGKKTACSAGSAAAGAKPSTTRQNPRIGFSAPTIHLGGPVLPAAAAIKPHDTAWTGHGDMVEDLAVGEHVYLYVHCLLPTHVDTASCPLTLTLPPAHSR